MLSIEESHTAASTGKSTSATWCCNWIQMSKGRFRPFVNPHYNFLEGKVH